MNKSPGNCWHAIGFDYGDMGQVVIVYDGDRKPQEPFKFCPDCGKPLEVKE